MKPDDIPQDVWDAAGYVQLDLDGLSKPKNWDDDDWRQGLIDNCETIARAIMAAKAEERERCVAIVKAALFHRDPHEIINAIRALGKIP